MKLKFDINENYLIAHTLSNTELNRFSSQKYEKVIRAFQKYAWKKSNRYYNLLVGKSTPEDLTDKSIKSFSKELPTYLKTIQESIHYQKLWAQTQRYLQFCENQWNTNYRDSIKTIEELTGFQPRKIMTVYITHPSLKNGIYLGNNKIAWGHNEDWPNYTTVYLWHEIMHSYFDTNKLDHVVISFVTDEELRVRLNGGEYPPFVTHEYLHSLMKKSLSQWKKYLKSKSKDIFEFKKQIMKL